MLEEELDELEELVVEELDPVGGTGEADPPPPPPPQAHKIKITNRKPKYFINLIKISHPLYKRLRL